MSTPGNTAKLGTAHSNIQTAQRGPSLVGSEPAMHSSAYYRVSILPTMPARHKIYNASIISNRLKSFSCLIILVLLTICSLFTVLLWKSWLCLSGAPDWRFVYILYMLGAHNPQHCIHIYIGYLFSVV